MASSVHPCIGQVCGQVVSGSHSSPGSVVPLPHWEVQSRSFTAVQPAGQHSSPSMHDDCVPAGTHTAAQVPSLFSRCFSHFSCAQLCGQLPAGSQISPASSRPLPQPPQSMSVAAEQEEGQHRSETLGLQACRAHSSLTEPSGPPAPGESPAAPSPEPASPASTRPMSTGGLTGLLLQPIATASSSTALIRADGGTGVRSRMEVP